MSASLRNMDHYSLYMCNSRACTVHLHHYIMGRAHASIICIFIDLVPSHRAV